MKHIPVFLAADALYTPFIATTIASMLDHTRAWVDFYILTDDMTEENKRKLSLLKNIYPNHSIEYLHVDTEKYMKNCPNISYYSLACYNRFLIPLLKPDLKKVIYSDVDVIYMDDIKKMYDIDLDGCGLAAPVEEIGLPLKGGNNHMVRKKEYGIEKNHLYFQSGNLIFDCDYWRKNHIMEKAFETTLEHRHHLRCPDLDVLNILFQNKYKKLDYRFSVCTHRILPEENDPEMLAAQKNPFCIHYASQRKPWNTRGIPFSEQFWHYARQTAFYEDILADYVVFSNREKIREVVVAKRLFRVLKIKHIIHKILSKVTFGKAKERQIIYRNNTKARLKKIKMLLTK